MKALSIKGLCTVICSIALCTVCASAQTRNYEYELSPFSSIEISNDFCVSIVQGTGHHATLTIEEPFKDYVKCEVKAGTLTISLDEKNVPSDVKKDYRGKTPLFKAEIACEKLVYSISLRDKAVLNKVTLETEGDFAINAIGSSEIRQFAVSAGTVSVTTERKVKGDIRAICQNFTASTTGSSDMQFSFQCPEATLNMQGGSNVQASGKCELLYVNSKGNARSTISGDARSAQFNLSGSCSVDAYELALQEAFVNMTSICTLKEAASQILHVKLSGGANLNFAGDPEIKIEGIKSSSMSPKEEK